MIMAIFNLMTKGHILKIFFFWNHSACNLFKAHLEASAIVNDILACRLFRKFWKASKCFGEVNKTKIPLALSAVSLFSLTSPKNLEAFRNFPNGRHANMLFTLENEKQNRMSFLNVKIICEDKKITTFVYYKLTFSGVHTHFESFLPSSYTFGAVYTLPYKCFSICSK